MVSWRYPQAWEGRAIELSILTSQPVTSAGATANVFHLQVLEHSFTLLRQPAPSLALRLRNLTASLQLANGNDPHDVWVALTLEAPLVNDIVTALAAIAEQAARDDAISPPQQVAIHRTLLAWMIYAQSFAGQEPPLGSPFLGHA